MSLIFGVFILGILAGWVLEWLLVYLFLPNPKQRLEAALQTSRQEVSKLQSRIRELEAKAATHAAPTTEITPQVTPPAPAATPKTEETTEATKTEKQPGPADGVAQTEAANVEATTTNNDNREPDDLTKLLGVGPKLAEAMQTAGITRFSQIAEIGGEEVAKRLSENGVRYVKTSVDTWTRQAKLAAQGNWEELKVYQESLK